MRLDLKTSVADLRILPANRTDDLTRSLDGDDLLLKRGIEAAQNGDRNTARELLVQVVARDPEATQAWMWLASISEYPEELLAFLDRVLAIEPANEKALKWRAATCSVLARTFVRRGMDAYNNGDIHLARRSLDQAVAHDEACESAWLWMSRLVDDDEQRVELLKRVISINPDNHEARKALDAIPKVDEPIAANPGLAVSEIPEQDAGSPTANLGNGRVDLDEAIGDGERRPAACPYCTAGNDANAFECGSCHATLTISDIERLIDNSGVDTECVRSAVTRMEAEWNLREFDANELVNLGIGHFNLRNYSNGIKYLQEASLLTPNDVILSGQINSLVIRLDEMRRRDPVNQPGPRGRTILVADDSSTVRKLISGKLERSGHVVLCAEDGAQALEQIAENLPDLVLLDITMPDMDGYEVCRQIRANPDSHDIPVVMISGRDGFFDKVRGRMAGTTAYITKPFGPETLMKALDSYLVNRSGNRT